MIAAEIFEHAIALFNRPAFAADAYATALITCRHLECRCRKKKTDSLAAIGWCRHQKELALVRQKLANATLGRHLVRLCDKQPPAAVMTPYTINC